MSALSDVDLAHAAKSRRKAGDSAADDVRDRRLRSVAALRAVGEHEILIDARRGNTPGPSLPSLSIRKVIFHERTVSSSLARAFAIA